jgi:hypothetical protein
VPAPLDGEIDEKLRDLLDLHPLAHQLEFLTLHVFAEPVRAQEEAVPRASARKVSKKELTDYANQLFKDNYVVLYKKEGEAKGLVKVQKPPLTAVTINRNDESKFFTEWKKIPADSIAPVFVDLILQLTVNNSVKGLN